jgi:hypothetical protein
VDHHKQRTKPKRLVWRMTERAPMGEWVDPDAPPPKPEVTGLPEVSTGGWLASSFDLLSGTDVSDDPDTVPSALFDELFHLKEDDPNAPKK